MARNLTNTNSTTNVYVNTNLTATLPLEENQSSFNNPIVISMKGLNGFDGAGKVIKINSNNDGLEYDDETDTVYTAITPLVINNLTNEISLSGLVGYGTAGYVLKTNGVSNTVGWALEQDTVYSFTSPLLNNGSNLISLGGLTAFGSGDANKVIAVNSGGTALIYSTQTDTTYTFQSPLVNFGGLNSISLDTVPTGKGGTGLLSYTTGDILYYSSGNVLTKLGIGGEGKVLTVNTGVPSWETTAVPDLTTSKDFGTAVVGGNTIKLGNSAGTNQTTPLELYTSGTLKIYNTSNVNVATFTPVSNTCNLDLKGGLITTATLSTNTLWNGTTIEIGYGGTGLSTLSGQANKLLQVNSGATGYTFTTLPTSLFALTSSTIHPTSSAYNLALGQATSASSTYTLYVNGKIFTNDTITITAGTAFTTGFNTFSLPSSSGQLALTTQIPSAIWSVNGSIISPASSSNYTIQLFGSASRVVGDISNPTAPLYPFVKYGSFKELFTTDVYVTDLFIENNTGTYTNVKLTCNSAYDTLEISDDVNINGSLTTTTSVTSNKFIAVNNSNNYMESNSTHGFGFYGNASRQLTIRGISDFPFLGCDGTNNFVLHINNIGDAYNLTHPSSGTAGFLHYYNGSMNVGGYASFLSDNTGGGGGSATAIGFQTRLPGYSPVYPVLIVERLYGYFGSNITGSIGTGNSSGSYDGYWGNGGVGNASDRRLKTNINTIENPIDTIKKLRGVNYEWVCANKPKGIQFGYIAQEVNEVLPSICDLLPTTNECCPDGTWGIKPTLISAILVEGIKEQQIEIDTLKTELNAIKELLVKNNIV
tara:strand:- start:2586 stop:5042 length:2457 start_codon:yes stop_codon:yes gene_type:complete